MEFGREKDEGRKRGWEGGREGEEGSEGELRITDGEREGGNRRRCREREDVRGRDRGRWR